MSNSWTIGSGPDCDLVVDRPVVSGRHCRLTRLDDGYFLEDLGSTNGTFVNGRRVASGVRVTRSDAVTLGASQPLPWPDERPVVNVGDRPVVLGRDPECDRVFDLPTISGRHARLFRADGRVLVEDLGSSNGTYVNGRRVGRPEVVRPGDSVGLGSHVLRVVAEPGPAPTAGGFRIVPGTDPAVTAATAAPLTEPPPAREAARNPWAGLTTLAPAWVGGLLVGQALVLSLVIVSTRGGTGSLFWLALLAVWLGLSGGALGAPNGPTVVRRGPTAFLARFAVTGASCGLGCLVAWVVVSTGCGLKAWGVPALVLLALTSGVSLALGLGLATAAGRPPAAWAGLPLVVLPSILLGGDRPPATPPPAWARGVSNALPSRWAFEGLLLLESEARGGSDHPADLAEAHFPADTDRMGLTADALALGAMALGLVAAGAFISEPPRPTST